MENWKWSADWSVGIRNCHCLNSAAANICLPLQLAGVLGTSLAAFYSKILTDSYEKQLMLGALLLGLSRLLEFQHSIPERRALEVESFSWGSNPNLMSLTWVPSVVHPSCLRFWDSSWKVWVALWIPAFVLIKSLLTLSFLGILWALQISYFQSSI